jgi:hypothetical protein
MLDNRGRVNQEVERMAKKKSSASKSKKGSTGSKKDVQAFVDYIHTDKKMRGTVKKGWDAVIQAGKKQGYKFTKQDLHNHLKKKYGVTSSQEGDEPDTCICI